jgi:hypothetical protein
MGLPKNRPEPVILSGAKNPCSFLVLGVQAEYRNPSRHEDRGPRTPSPDPRASGKRRRGPPSPQGGRGLVLIFMTSGEPRDRGILQESGPGAASKKSLCVDNVARPAFQSPHQNRHRSAQTRHTLRMGRDWPVKRATRKLPPTGQDPPDEGPSVYLPNSPNVETVSGVQFW